MSSSEEIASSILVVHGISTNINIQVDNTTQFPMFTKAHTYR